TDQTAPGWTHIRRDLRPVPMPVPLLGGNDIGKDEAVALDDFTDSHRNLFGKHGTRGDYGMKLAILTARVDAFRQIAQQIKIESASGKLAIETPGIDTN